MGSPDREVGEASAEAEQVVVELAALKEKVLLTQCIQQLGEGDPTRPFRTGQPKNEQQQSR